MKRPRHSRRGLGETSGRCGVDRDCIVPHLHELSALSLINEMPHLVRRGRDGPGYAGDELNWTSPKAKRRKAQQRTCDELMSEGSGSLPTGH
jgi:hypothetical protein